MEPDGMRAQTPPMPSSAEVFGLRSPASGATRRFRRLSQAVEEVGEARIFAGAHSARRAIRATRTAC
jgi:hypothetical protein